MNFFKINHKNFRTGSGLCLLRAIILSAGSFLIASPLFGQNEAALKQFFEGKMVVVKIDMPATKAGIDVYPRKAEASGQPIDYSKYGERLKKHGTAIGAGEQVMITKIKTKRKHIEFQLRGGGYGTAGDESADMGTPHLGKTKREKNLEKAIKNEPDPRKKKAMQEELDDLRKEREKEQKRLRLEAEYAKAARQERIREKALRAGSRFNIRYGAKLTAAEKTPEAVMAALQDFLEFPFAGLVENEQTERVEEAPESRPPAKTASLRKGLLWEEVAIMMGAPSSVSERMEGSLKVVACTFEKGQKRIDAEFVEGVLIRYTIYSVK